MTHWGAKNVRGDSGGGNSNLTDYAAPSFPVGGTYTDAQTSDQPGAQHLDGFNTHHADGHAAGYQYGSTTPDDWTAWTE